jgi:hypothetical protein
MFYTEQEEPNLHWQQVGRGHGAVGHGANVRNEAKLGRDRVSGKRSILPEGTFAGTWNVRNEPNLPPAAGGTRANCAKRTQFARAGEESVEQAPPYK